MIVARTEAPVSAAAAPVSKKTKSKSSKAVSDLAEIINIVQQAPLTKDQMQTLVESIISKMESEDSWTTKVRMTSPSLIYQCNALCHSACHLALSFERSLGAVLFTTCLHVVR